MLCPACKSPLQLPEVRTKWKYGYCQSCHGRLFSFGLLAEHSQPRHVLKLVKAANSSTQKSKFYCSQCNKRMVAALDQYACVDCHLFWILNYNSESFPKAFGTNTKKESSTPSSIELEIHDRLDSIFLRLIEHFTQKLGSLNQALPSLTSNTSSKASPIFSYVFSLILFTIFNLPLYANSIKPVISSTFEADRNSLVIYQYNAHYLDQFSKAIHLGFPTENSLDLKLVKVVTGYLIPQAAIEVVASIFIFLLIGTKIEKYIGSLAFAGILFLFSYIGFAAHPLIISEQPGVPIFLCGSAGGMAGLIGFYVGGLLKKGKIKQLKLPGYIVIFLALTIFEITSHIVGNIPPTTVSGNTGWIITLPLGLMLGFI